MTPHRIIKESPHQKLDGSQCPGGEKKDVLNYPQTLFALEAASQGMDITSGQCRFCQEKRPADGSVLVEIHVEDIPRESDDPDVVKIRHTAIMAQVNIEDNNYPGLKVFRRTN